MGKIKYTTKEVEERLDNVEVNEEITAAAFNDLNKRIKKLPTDAVVDNKIAKAVAVVNESHTKDVEVVNESVAALTSEVVTDEEVTVAALNDLREKIEDIITRLTALEGA